MASSAEEKLQAGDAKRAAEIYEELLVKFPTYEGTWAARYNLAFAYYLLDEYDKASTKFKELLGDRNPDKELREQALVLLATVKMSQALSLPKEKLEDRDQALDEAIKLFSEYNTKYPEGKNRADALYGKAAAQYQADKLEDSEKTLLEFSQKESKSSLRTDATYLIARVYAAMALKAQDAKNTQETQSKVTQALKYFDQVSSNPKDTVQANQALFSAGDLLYRIRHYPEAIQQLRRVRSQTFIEAEQKNLIDQLGAAIRQARIESVKSGARILLDDLNKQMDRATKRLKSIQEGTPLFVSAQQLISQCFYDQKQYDEVLILNRHFLPHFSPEQRKRSNYMIIKALLGKREGDEAVKEFQAFNKTNPNDPISKDIYIAIAQFYIGDKKYDQAIQWCDAYETAYPETPVKGQTMSQTLEWAQFLAATAATQSGNVTDAQARNSKFSKNFPNSTLAGEALYNQAFTKYQASDYEGALKDFREYITKFPNSALNEAVTFLIADCFFRQKKYDDAIKEFQIFEKKYPSSKSLIAVLVRMGGAYQAKHDIATANSIYARIVKDFPNEDLAVDAQSFIIRNLIPYASKQLPELLQAIDDFIKKYPDNAASPDYLITKAEVFESVKKPQEALASYEDVIKRYPQSNAAGEARVAIGDISKNAAPPAANPSKLLPEKLALWKECMQKAQTAYEEVLQKHPQSAAVDKALTQLSAIWQTKAYAKLSTKEEVKAYFDKLASVSNPELQVKIAFTLGSLFAAMQDKDAALDSLATAYEKAGDISLPNSGYDQYRDLLIEKQHFDKAIEISSRQLTEKQAANDQGGIAEALMGRGRAKFEKGDISAAVEDLKIVAEKFAWHEKAGPESEFYLIWADEKKKDYSTALNRYEALTPKIKKNTDLLIRTYMRRAFCYWNRSTTPGANKVADLTQAFSFYLRVGKLYGAFPPYASEALYHAGEISELGLVPTNDPKKSMS